MCGFALYYHGNDYTAINDANRFAGLRAKLVSANAHRPLFNGNISAMAVNIGVLNKPVLYNYTYDQLNRLVAMDVFNGTNTGANLWSGTLTAVNGYRERISYDANGNILKYFRKADSTGTSAALNGNMDSLTYNYIAASNKLSYVRDRINNSTTHSSNQTTDIDDQTSTTNYTYDAIGNLLTDAAESITSAAGGIKWNVYGKITEINKASTGNSSVKKITYTYDAAGNRISKKIERYNNAATDYTYYVRDASGNTMSVYAYTDSLRLTEQYLYGSSRLGSSNPNINMQRAEPAGVNMPLLSSTGKTSNFIRGLKFFELSNHLGNVLVVLSDKKKGIQNGTTGSVLYYLPVVKSAQDYYPFGMIMPGRKFTATTNYRYGFNGKEEDDEVKGDGNQIAYENRIFDPRLGRWLSLDPLQKKYPDETNYGFVSNNPLIFSDVDGRDKIYTLTLITKDGTVHIQKWTQKDVFIYSKVSVKGYGNDRFYKQDIYVNVRIDHRNGTGSISQDLGIRNQIPTAFYYWDKVSNKVGNMFSAKPGSQTSGVTFTSSFALEMDGPKTLAKIPTGEVYNIDALMAMAAYTKSGEVLNLKLDDLAEWLNHAKETAEALKELNGEEKEIQKKKPEDFKIIKRKPAEWFWSNEYGGHSETPRKDTVKKKGSNPDDPDTLLIIQITPSPNPSKKKKN